MMQDFDIRTQMSYVLNVDFQEPVTSFTRLKIHSLQRCNHR